MVAGTMTILAVVAVAGIIVLAQPAKAITKEQVYNICQPQSGASEADVKKLNSGDWSSNDPASKKYILCYMKSIGTMDDSNNFNKEAFFPRLPKNLTREEVEAHLDDCIKQQLGKTPEEFAWDLAACYFTKYPSPLVLN